ncbi:MAG TPA: VWA domain-containing protein [Candidatus Dormibacteraeota bacterium]|nr:VWA domain-containing protein [Candidatus Dormibacteraeota bacterium]
MRSLSGVSLLVTLGLCCGLQAQAPATQSGTSSPVAPATDAGKTTPAQAPASGGEVTSRDTPATFKVRVNLVLVRVVVRDSDGKPVGNLKQEDFQLFDNRKAQAIVTFSMETPQTRVVKNVDTTPASEPADAAGPAGPATPAAQANVSGVAQRFVAMVFDDINLSIEDSTFVRKSAERFLGKLAPSDRVAMFSTSGQVSRDFTNDREALEKALLGIVPRPLAQSRSTHNCPDISYYQADLMENKGDQQARAVATEDAVQCAFQGDETQIAAAQAMAESEALNTLAAGDADANMVYRHLEDHVRRLVSMPGERVMVLVSPGFIPSTLWSDISSLIDRATRAKVVINTIDARGLYTPDISGDIASPAKDSFRTAGYKASYRVQAQSAQDEVLAALADGTGGTFFHNRNDIDVGMERAGASPEVSYVLGFSPQNLKIDGSFHTIKVSLGNKLKYSLQSRRGYYAPKALKDPGEAAKEEIQEAIFSQEEIHDLPVELQTQFFKKDAAEARLAVLTHFDLKGIRFRKAEGRNLDNVTIATAIFDENGNFVTGGEKIVEMKLLDTTYDRLTRNGFTVKSSFDIKPGTYMVRMVVRDGEGQQMAARNGAVVIPN